MNSTLIFILVLGYVIGSIPFGLIWSRVFGLGDLRKTGSGNIGATNVLRTGNKLAAFLTLAFDMGKGALAVIVAFYFYGEYAALIAGLGAMLGHLYPIWLHFNGGKGVATFLGVMLAVNFLVGLLCCATWLVVAAAGRISSLAALIAAVAAPLWMWILNPGPAVSLAIALGALVRMRHAANIGRLMRGEEPKIGAK